MVNELQKTLTERAKELLKSDGDHSLFEIAQLLRQFRKSTHPDLFQNEELKKQAEIRFKDTNALLDEVEKQLEVERFNRQPADVALYKPLYDIINLQSELDKTNKELEDAKSELSDAKSELLSEREKNDALRKELQTKNDDSVIAEIKHLQSVYKPSTRKYASLGLAIVLSGALSIMLQMENVSNILKKYSPFGQQYISTGLFFCLLLFLFIMFRKLWEREYIRGKSEEVCSPKFAGDFMEYLKIVRHSDEPIFEFSEVEVFDFILGERQWLKSIVSFFGFQIFRRETVNQLKDIFIHTLLNKKLVDISRAEGMQRYFKILSSREDRHYWYFEYEKLKEKTRKEASTEDDFD